MLDSIVENAEEANTREKKVVFEYLLHKNGNDAR